MATSGHESSASSPLVRCAGCNAPVQWSPGQGAVACKWCEETQKIEARHPPRPETMLAEFEAGADQRRLDEEERRQVSCRSCGATLDFEEHHARRCDFCGATAIAESRQTSSIAPSAIAPFKVTRDQAVEAYQKWVEEQPFVPGPVRRGVPVDELRGVYVPYWVFDLTVHRWFKCWGGYIDEGALGVGQKIFEIGNDDGMYWLWRKGWNELERKNLAVCASRGLSEKLVPQVSDLSLRGLHAYDPRWVSGYAAEAPGPSPIDAWPSAERFLDAEQREQIRTDELGDADYIRDLVMDKEYRDVKVRLVYLPMWVAAYRFSGRIFRFVVDGRTGRAVGDVPFSRRQAMGLAIGAVVVLAIAAAVAAPSIKSIYGSDDVPEDVHAPTPVTMPADETGDVIVR